ETGDLLAELGGGARSRAETLLVPLDLGGKPNPDLAISQRSPPRTVGASAPTVSFRAHRGPHYGPDAPWRRTPSRSPSQRSSRHDAHRRWSRRADGHTSRSAAARPATPAPTHGHPRSIRPTRPSRTRRGGHRRRSGT